MPTKFTSADLEKIKSIIYAIDSAAHTLGYFSSDPPSETEKLHSQAWQDFGAWLQRMEDKIDASNRSADHGGQSVVARCVYPGNCYHKQTGATADHLSNT